jgi:hypothetical protein
MSVEGSTRIICSISLRTHHALITLYSLPCTHYHLLVILYSSPHTHYRVYSFVGKSEANRGIPRPSSKSCTARAIDPISPSNFQSGLNHDVGPPPRPLPWNAPPPGHSASDEHRHSSAAAPISAGNISKRGTRLLREEATAFVWTCVIGPRRALHPFQRPLPGAWLLPASPLGSPRRSHRDLVPSKYKPFPPALSSST